MRLYQVLDNGKPASPVGYPQSYQIYPGPSIRETYLEAWNYARATFKGYCPNSMPLNKRVRFPNSKWTCEIRSVEIPDEIYFAPEDRP